MPEFVRTETLMNVGLIVLGVYILQAFMSSSVTDVAARVSVAAWTVAIPLLAFLVLLNQLQESYRYASQQVYLFLARALALGAAVIGFGAAVWHLWMPASIVLIASGLGWLFIIRRTVAVSNETIGPNRRRLVGHGARRSATAQVRGLQPCCLRTRLPLSTAVVRSVAPWQAPSPARGPTSSRQDRSGAKLEAIAHEIRSNGSVVNTAVVDASTKRPWTSFWTQWSTEPGLSTSRST